MYAKTGVYLSRRHTTRMSTTMSTIRNVYILQTCLSLNPFFGMKESRYAKIDMVYFEREKCELSEYQIRFSLPITVFPLFSVAIMSFLRLLAHFWVLLHIIDPLKCGQFCQNSYQGRVTIVFTLY